MKNGAVQDKLWLPGIRKLKTLIQQGFLEIFSPSVENLDTGYLPGMIRTSLPSDQVGIIERRTEEAL